MKKQGISKNTKGFTLIELMIAVAIIGFLTMVAYPKFINSMIKAKEANVKGDLASVRSAVNIFYASKEVFPTSLQGDLVPDFLNELPEVEIPATTDGSNPGHDERGGVTSISDDDMANGAWYFVDTGTDWGEVQVNCTHPSTNGVIWSAF